MLAEHWIPESIKPKKSGWYLVCRHNGQPVKPYDVHKTTAVLLFNKPENEITEDEREFAKKANYLSIYPGRDVKNHNYVYDSEISMREFICYYIPGIWKEPINKVCFVPYWTKDEYEAMKLGNWTTSGDRPTDTWYFKEAFNAWMAKMKQAEEKGLLRKP